MPSRLSFPIAAFEPGIRRKASRLAPLPHPPQSAEIVEGERIGNPLALQPAGGWRHRDDIEAAWRACLRRVVGEPRLRSAHELALLAGADRHRAVAESRRLAQAYLDEGEGGAVTHQQVDLAD